MPRRNRASATAHPETPNPNTATVSGNGMGIMAEGSRKIAAFPHLTPPFWGEAIPVGD